MEREGRTCPHFQATTQGFTAAFPDGFILRRQIPECAPITLNRLETPKYFTLCGRKTRNECRPLNPFLHKTRCKPDRETCSKTVSKPVQNIRYLCPELAKIIVPMGDGFATRPATNRLSLRRINAEPGSDFRGLIPESVKLLVVQITAKHLSAKHWLAAVRFALAHACSSQDNQLFPSAIDGVHPAYSRSPAPLVGAIASPRALRIGLCRATSCAFGIDLGSSLTRPL